MSTSFDQPTTRRNAVKIGGLTVTLGVLAAACGENRGGSDALGRVGNAPGVEPLEDYVVDDSVLLRTASSLEYTAIAVYETVLGLDGAVPSEFVPLVERLIENHQAVADEMVELTLLAGGVPWECPNPWFMERLVQPTVESILSNVIGVVQGDTSMVQVKGEILPIAPTVSTSVGDIDLISSTDGLSAGDQIEFTRLEGAVVEDVITFAIGFENLAAAAHQVLASATGLIEARTAHVRAATLEARHGSRLAIELAGGPDGYVSPTMTGGDTPTTDTGQIRKYAISSTFAQTAQVEIKAGPGDINNVRESVLLQTPADNSFVYNDLVPSCGA